MIGLTVWGRVRGFVIGDGIGGCGGQGVSTRDRRSGSAMKTGYTIGDGG